MPDLQIPRESKELIEVNVIGNGVAITTGLEVSVTAASNTRPTVWTVADTAGGKGPPMPDLQIPRESKELIEVSVIGNGVAITTGLEVSVTAASNTRPTVWTAADTAGGKVGILIGPGTSRNLGPGIYQVWCRVTSAPEIPVIALTNRVRIT